MGIPLILEEIMKRHSGRAFSNKPISDEQLNSILEAGRWAPSCANAQSWNFVILREKEILEKAHEHLTRGNAYAKAAPVMVLVTAKEDAGCSSHGLPYFALDVGLAVENMLLQAVHIGLMGHPTAEGDPETLDEVTREKERRPRTRRELAEIVHWNAW